MDRTRRKLKATAYHEAGHAVAAERLGIRFRRVTIVPSNDGVILGCLKHQSWPRRRNPAFTPDDPHTWRLVEKRVMVCFAGMVAEARFTKRKNHIGARFDYQQVTMILGYLSYFPSKLHEAHWRYLYAATEDLINRRTNWHAVKAVAAAVLKHERLKESEVSRIIQEAGNRAAGLRAMSIEPQLKESSPGGVTHN